jgi:hypothetical protein
MKFQTSKAQRLADGLKFWRLTGSMRKRSTADITHAPYAAALIGLGPSPMWIRLAAVSAISVFHRQTAMEFRLSSG